MTQAMQFYQVLRQATVILTGILLAKSGLPLTEIGTFEQLLFIGTTCTFFWMNGLLQGLLPIYPTLDENGRKSLIIKVFALLNGLAIGLFLLFFGLEKWVSFAFTGRAELPHFTLFAAWLALTIPSYPVEQFYLLKNRPAAIIAWGLAGFGLHLLAVILPIRAGLGLRGMLLAMLALAAARWIWAAFIFLKNSLPAAHLTAHFSPLTAYLKLSAPLAANSIIGNLIVVFDVWLVGWWFRDEAVFAIFRYGSREFPLAIALSAGLSAAMIPLLAGAVKTGLPELRRKSVRLMFWVFPPAIGLMLCSGWLFPQVFNSEFSEAAPIFNIYLFLATSRVVLTPVPMMAFGETRAIFWVSIIELLVKILTGFLFIHLWGLSGLAWSMVVAFWVEKLGQAWFLRRKYGIGPGEIVDFRWLVFWSLGLMGAWFLS